MIFKNTEIILTGKRELNIKFITVGELKIKIAAIKDIFKKNE